MDAETMRKAMPIQWGWAIEQYAEHVPLLDRRERWEVTRRGERADIPTMTRLLVRMRDNFRCVRCGWDDLTEMDHVFPWSAGGSDYSDNLQTLCTGCNSERSNYVELWLPRVIPVAPVCDPCYLNHGDLLGEPIEEGGWGWMHGTDKRPVWKYCSTCLYGEIPDPGDQRVPVFCGSCTATSWVSCWSRTL